MQQTAKDVRSTLKNPLDQPKYQLNIRKQKA